MAELITGIPGSGKSYYAMYKIYYNQDKYFRIHTNIDGLKTTDKIQFIDFKKFSDEVLSICYDMIVNQTKSFDEVINYLTSINILPTDPTPDNKILIVIDEAQNYFNKKNPVLLWFITQHRHLFIEIYLITQKYTLIHSDYHLFNMAYAALAPVKQIRNNVFVYNEYAGLPMNNDNFVKRFTIKKEQKVFDMYISGDQVKSPNILKRYFIYLLIFIIFILIGSYYLLNFFTPKKDDEDKIQKSTTTIQNSEPKKLNYFVSNNDRLYVFVIFDNYFHLLHSDKYDETDYPLTLLIFLKKKYFKKILVTVKHDNFHSSVYAICSKNIENFLIKDDISPTNTILNNENPKLSVNAGITNEL